jgi:adenylate cyclase
MRIGIRLAISGLVLASIMVSAIGVHVLWWRTAEANSHALAAMINVQIVSAVEKELTIITTEARAAHTAIRTLFLQNVLETREADKREFVFLSQLQSQQSISWVAFGWPDGAFFAAHKLGDLGLEMMEIARVGGAVKRRIDQYQVVVGDIQFEKRWFENTDYAVTDQEWYRTSMQTDEPRWFDVTVHPVGLRPSITYAGSDRRVPETPRCACSYHRIHAARAISVATLRRKIRRGFHPGSRWDHHRRTRSGC